jgi:hypothetical protein
MAWYARYICELPSMRKMVSAVGIERFEFSIQELDSDYFSHGARRLKKG